MPGVCAVPYNYFRDTGLQREAAALLDRGHSVHRTFRVARGQAAVRTPQPPDRSPGYQSVSGRGTETIFHVARYTKLEVHQRGH